MSKRSPYSYRGYYGKYNKGKILDVALINFAENGYKGTNLRDLAAGMCFGVAIDTSLGNNTGIGLSLGMLAGLVIGSYIEKKKKDGEE